MRYFNWGINSMNRLIICIQAYNEESMIKYSLPSVYNDCDEVILIDGAVEGWFPTIHSTDDTVEIAKSIDVDKKLTVVQKDSYFKSLEEIKHTFTKYVPIGDYFCILDCDELYIEGTLSKLRKIMAARPQYTDYIGIFKEFAFDLRHILRPEVGVTNLTHQRIVKNEPGARWDIHHPTMATGPNGSIDTCFDPSYTKRRIVIPDLNIYHIGCIKPVEFQVQKRARYYTTFDKLPPGLARMKAEEEVNAMKDRLMIYDGPLPKVLQDHPLNIDTLNIKAPNWRSTVEYNHPELIPKIYNTQWKSYPKASVVIACYRNAPDLLRNICKAWSEVLYDNIEIIFVDDGSPADEAKIIEEIVTSYGFKYYYNDSGDSYCIGEARNIGIWNSTGNRVIFTDSDVIPSPNMVMEHMIAGQYNNIVVGPRSHITEWDGNGIPKESIPDPRLTDAFPRIEKGQCFDPHEHCHGCNISAPRASLIRVNGFDSEYSGTWGAEDIDLAYRLIKLGHKVRPAPNALCYHIDHPSRNQGGQRDLLNRKMAAGITTCNRPKSWV
jgi:glycosyltransferase involved in cell wall biosynthesis